MADDRSVPLQVVQLLTAHQLTMQGYAYSIVRDFHLVEDVYQEVASVVVSRWEDVPQGAGTRPWLLEVTRRKSLELLRRTRRERAVLSEEVLARVESEAAPAETADPARQDLRDVMSACVERLEGVARTVVEARYRENEPCEAIAQRVKRSVQSVYSILKRARSALLECVDRARTAEAQS